ncbi:D-alanyl-D-alanine carboxypeptidase/D-alanyl-D-alanine endopeptidase [Tropicimonas marinistellae]|uniref:D-alanyl-D-alanine carboxypeptidase/D-alanyl-D-alanine endopeptidase n=1 Tax=Tropicimonas marinistellae TaxID=1739787 RepID=UPI000834E833|nr:D-alanyl-D-alanine carboxypeptidase/D-alanyl-D-alanine-endopeptidase [Tropicimonas marinistellae]
MSDTLPFLTRRMLVAGLLSASANVALAGPPQRSLRPAPRGRGATGRMAPSAENLVDRARLDGAKVGFVVANAENGEVLEVMKPLLPQPPASTAKALTALYALDALGPEHRFPTRLIATGPIEAGALKGDLILAGAGDPTLDTTRLAELVAALKAAGVVTVDGSFLAWDGALPNVTHIDPEQPVQVGYNPAVSGLNLNFNRVHFEWRRAGAGWTTAMDARAKGYRPDVQVARMSIAKRRYPIYTYEDDGQADIWTVASGALGQSGSRWLPVRKPTAYTAEVFQIIANSEGIRLGAAKPVSTLPEGTEIARVESNDLRSLLRDMLKYSTNVTAEAIGMSATVARGPDPTSLVDSAGRMSRWLGSEIGSPRPALVDHSGLGGGSRITARDMVRALVTLGPPHGLEPLLKPIRMKDSKGRPMESYPATIMAKTGTLNFVSALAGYIALPGGGRLAFATFVADPARRDAIPVAERERPQGVKPWTARARTLQLRLIDRWVTLYDAAS